MRNVTDRGVDKTKKKSSIFNNVFQLRAVYQRMFKNRRLPERSQTKICTRILHTG